MNKHPLSRSDIANASIVVNKQLDILRMLDKKYSKMNFTLYSKIRENVKKGNNERAKILATELANLRKIKLTTQNLSLALEVMVIRFTTINEFADILDTINPMVDTIKTIQKDISQTILEDMNSVTSDILGNTNLKIDIPNIDTPMNSDALDIFNEIKERITEETKSRLPLPPVIDKALYTEQNDLGEDDQLSEKEIMIET
ncbi:MAG: hypothetical protein DA328_09115 [Nitrososphaeraceae archaeon]|nr:hypothetical protein [Nitrososphaeraceae archaeon]